MNFTNPTPIRVGMVGTFFGKRYRVAGRVVLGMSEGGQTYYWNEFNLLSLDEQSATLVFEVGDQGGEWRLFTCIDPGEALSAEAAASKRVGEEVCITGKRARITLISQSRIYHIEGDAPEGEEIGDVAHYFNAQAGESMIVVSWTGDEVEYFQGVNLSYATVKTAFNLQADMPEAARDLLGSPRNGLPSAAWVRLVGAFLGIIVVFVVYSVWSSGRRSQGVMRFPAPPSPLQVGSTGSLEGTRYLLQLHEVIDLAEVGMERGQQEYHLIDKEGTEALLVYGWKLGAKDWVLLKRLAPVELTPQQAAARHVGDIVSLGRYAARITELFRASIRQVQGAESSESKAGLVRYGFTAQTGSTVALVRWGESEIVCYAGHSVPAKEVSAAFGRSR